jgi:hypothetical protein
LPYFDDLRKHNYSFNEPDECPLCHHGIKPFFVKGYDFNSIHNINHHFRLVFQCPREECSELFIAFYYKDPLTRYVSASSTEFYGCAPLKPRNEVFENVIQQVSPLFVEIYNQAKEAETRKLDQICGLGYRKAFEFLIKDYLVKKYPEKEDEIKNDYRFMNLIKQYVEDDKVKKLAERASWLGNDHAHYTKKWVDKDIEDLKRIIKTTIYWISAELEFEHYVNEMK